MRRSSRGSGDWSGPRRLLDGPPVNAHGAPRTCAPPGVHCASQGWCPRPLLVPLGHRHPFRQNWTDLRPALHKAHLWASSPDRGAEEPLGHDTRTEPPLPRTPLAREDTMSTHKNVNFDILFSQIPSCHLIQVLIILCNFTLAFTAPDASRDSTEHSDRGRGPCETPQLEGQGPSDQGHH